MKFIMTVLLMSNLLLADDCTTSLSKTAGEETNWRSAISHRHPSGREFTTDPQRENNIRISIELMKKEITGNLWPGNTSGDTPPMIVVPTSDTQIRFTKAWEEYGDMHAEVTGAKDGVLRATVLVPVSGHTGIVNAKKWAKTDTFSLSYDNGSESKIPLVTDVKSLDLITANEIEIKLINENPVTLHYTRSGSLGPAGFAGGRVLHLTWKKDAAITPATDFSKPFWSDTGH